MQDTESNELNKTSPEFSRTLESRGFYQVNGPSKGTALYHKCDKYEVLSCWVERCQKGILYSTSNIITEEDLLCVNTVLGSKDTKVERYHHYPPMIVKLITNMVPSSTFRVT